MSIPRFNLSKLRNSVLLQQSVTKRDIYNLLLLDRLQANVQRKLNKKDEKVFSYRLFIWSYNKDEALWEQLTYIEGLQSNISLCKSLESKSKSSYLLKKFLEALERSGCDETEDEVTSKLNTLTEGGEESKRFLPFDIKDVNGFMVRCFISVQRY